MPRVSTIDTARAVALYGEYGSVARVAEAVGASVSGVWRALKRAGVAMAGAAARMKALHADPEFKAAHAARSSARMKALNADPEFKARHRAAIRRHFDGCEVPSWVPADLRDDYIDVARLSGEEVAASHVRRLKREAAL